MIVIYTQDRSYIFDGLDSAKETIISLYGEKLGTEAYYALKRSPTGAAYRRYGGPLITIVNSEKAEWIRNKEKSLEITD